MFYLWSQESSSAISDYENCQHAITQNNKNIQNKSQKNMQQAQEIWGQNEKGFFILFTKKPRETMNKFVICPEIIMHCIWRSHIWAFVVLKGSVLQRYRLFPRKILLPFLTWIILCQLLLQCKTASSYQQLNIPLESGKSIWKLSISFDGVHNRKGKNLCYCELGFVYNFRRFK